MPARNQAKAGHPENDVDVALAGLRELYQRVSSPVIRACLESARDDIAHLAGGGRDERADDDLLDQEGGDAP